MSATRSRSRASSTGRSASPVTAMTAGFATGTAVGGSLVEAVDWRACFVAAAIAGALAALIAYSQRRTLVAAPQPA